MFIRKRRQKGAAVYETLISLPVLLLLIFLGIKGMVLSYRALVLQYAAGQAVRKLALGICDGPKLESNGVPSNAAETTDCGGALDDQKARATYVYDYARLISYRFGLTLSNDRSAPNKLNACILPLGDAALTTACKGYAHDLSGVPLPSGNTASYGVLQLRTDSGLGLFKLQGSDSGSNAGFDLTGTHQLSAVAVARIERLNP